MIQNRSRAGLTMIEVVIASAILIAVVAMTFGLLVVTTNTTSNQQTITTMEERLLLVLDRVTNEIRNSGGVYTLTVPTQLGDAYFDNTLVGVMAYHTSLSFGVNSGFQIVGKAGNAVFTTKTVRFFWRIDFGETLNNLDDDNDGWIDEGVVVREETDTTLGTTTESVLCYDVPRRALTFQFPSIDNPPKAVTINLQIMGRDVTQGGT